MRAYVRSLLRIFAAMIACVLLMVVVVGLVFFLKPRWLLNESVLRMAAGMMSKGGIAITWTGVEIDAETVGLLKRKVSLDFTGLCIREQTLSAYDGCFKRARVTAVGGLVRLVPKITEAGPIDLESGKVLLDLDRLAEVEKNKPPTKVSRKKPKPFRIEEVAPIFIRNARVLPIHIEVPQWEVREKGKRILGELFFAEEGTRITLSAKGTSQVKRGPFVRRERYDVALDLSNDRDFWAWNHWRAVGKAHARLADQRTVEVNLDVSPHFVSLTEPKGKSKQTSEAIALDFTVDGNTKKGAELISAEIKGSYVPQKLEAKISGTARNLIPEVRRIALKGCALILERKGPQAESRYRFDCQVGASVPIPPERLALFEIPTEAGLRVQADLISSDFIPSDTTQLEGKVDVVLTPILTPLLQGSAELHGRLSGVAGEFPGRGKIDSNVAAEVRIPDFQKLAKKLAKTDWGIPAPFQAFEGDVTFRSTGSANMETGIFPLRLRTRLQSKSQSMNRDAGGTFEVSDVRTDPYSQLNFLLTLSDLKILLPRLRLEKPPRIVADDRIHALDEMQKKPKEEKSSSFGYRVVIRTPPGKPAQVITNLAKAPIPVNLNLNLANDSPMLGKIAIGTFPVEAFRRKAIVQHFDIDLNPEIGSSGIDGRVEVPLGDYRTRIELVGTIDEPQVRISSDPPVGEDQLMAALLFNRTPEELDSSQSAAVGSTRATVSQGALSLASLFLLASTPIESLIYNPDTGAVTAQVRLAEGLSLNVGTGEKQSGAVGLRKRLGSNFFITTDVSNIIQNTSTVSAYLEWRRRY